MATKDDGRRKLEEHIDDVEAKIAHADRKVSEAEGDLQAYYREALVKLKEVKQVANAKLEKLQDSSEEAWEDLKDDVDEAVERLRSNLDALMERFRDEPARKTPVHRGHKVRTKGKSGHANKAKSPGGRNSRSKRG